MDFKFTSRKEELEKSGIIGREFRFISQKGNVIKGEIAKIVSVMLGGQIKFSTSKGVEYLLSQIQEPIELVSLIKQENERIDEILVLERIEYNKILETQEVKPFELNERARRKLDSLIPYLQTGIINKESKELLENIVLSASDAFDEAYCILEELAAMRLLNFYAVTVDYYADGVFKFDNENDVKHIKCVDNERVKDFGDVLQYSNSVECFFTLEEAMERYNRN